MADITQIVFEGFQNLGKKIDAGNSDIHKKIDGLKDSLHEHENNCVATVGSFAQRINDLEKEEKKTSKRKVVVWGAIVTTSIIAVITAATGVLGKILKMVFSG